ncbi:MAG TPA: hypothetical protein VND68_04570 [Chloroflexia bacterium]|nr:hypothetical protein [Chloroflexia bacterium]
MSKVGERARKFYRAEKARLLGGAYALWAIAALIPIVVIFLAYTRLDKFPMELAIASVAAGAIFLVAGYSVYRQATVYLVTSPEGVEYHTGGKVLGAAWSEIRSLGMIPAKPHYPVEGLIVRSKVAPPAHVPVQREQGWFIWYIPLQPFGWYWKESGLGDEIRRYAPHLLNTPQEQPSTSHV